LKACSAASLARLIALTAESNKCNFHRKNERREQRKLFRKFNFELRLG